MEPWKSLRGISQLLAGLCRLLSTPFASLPTARSTSFCSLRRRRPSRLARPLALASSLSPSTVGVCGWFFRPGTGPADAERSSSELEPEPLGVASSGARARARSTAWPRWMLAERARVVKELPESERSGGGGAGLLAAAVLEAGDMAACSGGSAESEASGGDAGLCRRRVEALELVEAEEAD